jgi:hypothetical protein
MGDQDIYYIFWSSYITPGSIGGSTTTPNGTPPQPDPGP